jgi:hypothetical protein
MRADASFDRAATEALRQRIGRRLRRLLQPRGVARLDVVA